MKKIQKLFSILMAVVLSLAIVYFPIDTEMAYASELETLDYRTPVISGGVLSHFDTSECTNYTVVDSETVDWTDSVNDGWYVVKDDAIISERVKV